MDQRDGRQVAEGIWKALGAGDWDAVGSYLHDDFVQEWPQSGERIVGRENALSIDRNFPGGLPKASVRRTIADGSLAVSEVELRYADGSVYQGVTILELREGKVTRETDYFAQRFEAPQWRARWVERR